LRLWKNLAWIPMEPATTLMMFWVSVPILSVQAAEAFAIEGQISSGAATDDTEVVVQGLPNDVIRHVARTTDLELESLVDLPIPDTTFQGFDFDLCYSRFKRFGLLRVAESAVGSNPRYSHVSWLNR